MMQTAKYYSSISNLPLSKFIECQVKKNIYALVISGDPDPDDLRLAWQDIILEYNDRMQDNETKMYNSVSAEVALIQSKLSKIDAAIDMLKGCMDYYKGLVSHSPEADIKIEGFHKKYSALLNEFVESNFPFDPASPDEFYADLKKAKTRSKSLLIKLELKNNNLKKLSSKNESENGEPTCEYYDSVLNELTVFVKTFIDDNITVSRFCDLVLKYVRHIKLLESQNKRK